MSSAAYEAAYADWLAAGKPELRVPTADPLRAPLTDEEPWSPCDAPAPTAARWRPVALAAVLLLLALRAVRHPGGPQ